MMDFRDITGQDAIIKQLKNAVRTDRISHAYMIIGEQGMGKKTIADAFALTLLCEKHGEYPCRECHSCRQVMAGSHPDCIYVTHEKPASISVDDVREQLTETADIRPYSGGRKIYIVPDAEKMTVQAQNALLKTIEEPPDYTVILLLTENAEVLLDTIRSRCVELKCRSLPDAEIVRFLTAKKKTDPEEAEKIAGFAAGNLGRALLLSESEEFRKSCEENLLLIRELPDSGMQDILKDISRIRENNEDLTGFLKFLRMWYRDLLICKTAREPEGLIFRSEEKELLSQSRRMNYLSAGKVLQEIDRAEDRLKANVNPDLTLEILLLAIADKTRSMK